MKYKYVRALAWILIVVSLLALEISSMHLLGIYTIPYLNPVLPILTLTVLTLSIVTVVGCRYVTFEEVK